MIMCGNLMYFWLISAIFEEIEKNDLGCRITTWETLRQFLEYSNFASTAQAEDMVLKPHEEKLHYEVTSSTKFWSSNHGGNPPLKEVIWSNYKNCTQALRKPFMEGKLTSLTTMIRATTNPNFSIN